MRTLAGRRAADARRPASAGRGLGAAAWRATGMACAGAWTYLAFFRGGFWRFRAKLEPARTLFNPGERITAVIPARNEEDVIAYPVRSLREHVRVIVADDESEDATGEIAHANGARVVRVASRPPRWKGKLWALHSGIEAAGFGAETRASEFFLLTDADIEYADARALPALLAQADRGFDLVSVMVRLRCESAAEKLLIPAFVFFFFMLYPPARVASGGGPAAAAGGCMLIRRETLERIGGIAAIRNALIDDCALAQRVRAAGGRVWLGLSDMPIRSIRAYGAAREIRAMISRSAFAQLRHSAPLLLATAAGMALVFLAPVALLFSRDRMARALGATAWMASAALFYPAVRLYGAPRGTAFCLPAIAAFYLVATIESAVRYWRGEGGVWKGRIQDAASASPDASQ